MSEWRPRTPVSPGELRPCGSTTDGRIREFFAHPDDVPALLADGIVHRELSTVTRYRVTLTSTPHYANGDVQVRAVAA